MQRRSALKNLSAAVGGLVALPAWANGWTPKTIGTTTWLSASQEALLADITETIIPQTNTPGAKSLKVHEFVQRMVNDCYGEAIQKGFKEGLAATEATAQKTYGKSFGALDTAQRLATLKSMSEAADTKAFVNLAKNLTIQGYTNSEYYLVNVQKYVMAPGFYHGCVPVAPKGSK